MLASDYFHQTFQDGSSSKRANFTVLPVDFRAIIGLLICVHVASHLIGSADLPVGSA